jgi:hypothetical protein
MIYTHKKYMRKLYITVYYYFVYDFFISIVFLNPQIKEKATITLMQFSCLKEDIGVYWTEDEISGSVYYPRV